MAGTRWVKIDISYLRNPKMTALSPGAVMLHLASILYCADHLSDGHIPRHALPELALMARLSRTAVQARADELIKAERWLPSGGDWYLHDFDEMNPQAMRAVVEAQRAKWREHKKPS
jgi:hypothetical protein